MDGPAVGGGQETRLLKSLQSGACCVGKDVEINTGYRDLEATGLLWSKKLSIIGIEVTFTPHKRKGTETSLAAQTGREFELYLPILLFLCLPHTRTHTHTSPCM